MYMRMDISLVRFIRVAEGTFRRWIYPDNPPRLPPRYSNDLNVLQAGLSFAGEPGPDWVIRALIGRYAEGIHLTCSNTQGIRYKPCRSGKSLRHAGTGGGWREQLTITIPFRIQSAANHVHKNVHQHSLLTVFHFTLEQHCAHTTVFS